MALTESALSATFKK